MTKTKQDDLTAAINTLPTHLDWLLRNDEQGFFANIMSSKFSASGGAEGLNAGVYAETPVLAVESAYRSYKALCTLHGVDQ